MRDLAISFFVGLLVGIPSVAPLDSDCSHFGCKPQWGAGPYDLGLDLSCNNDASEEVIILVSDDGWCQCDEDLACELFEDTCSIAISLSILRGGDVNNQPESYCIEIPGEQPQCVDWGFWMGPTQVSHAVTAAATGCDTDETSFISNSYDSCTKDNACEEEFCYTVIKARCRSCGYSCTGLTGGN